MFCHKEASLHGQALKLLSVLLRSEHGEDGIKEIVLGNRDVLLPGHVNPGYPHPLLTGWRIIILLGSNLRLLRHNRPCSRFRSRIVSQMLRGSYSRGSQSVGRRRGGRHGTNAVARGRGEGFLEAYMEEARWRTRSEHYEEEDDRAWWREDWGKGQRRATWSISDRHSFGRGCRGSLGISFVGCGGKRKICGSGRLAPVMPNSDRNLIRSESDNCLKFVH